MNTALQPRPAPLPTANWLCLACPHPPPAPHAQLEMLTRKLEYEKKLKRDHALDHAATVSSLKRHVSALERQLRGEETANDHEELQRRMLREEERGARVVGGGWWGTNA